MATSILKRVSISDSRSSATSLIKSLSFSDTKKSGSSVLKTTSFLDTKKSGNSVLKRVSISERECVKCQISERDIAFAIRVVLPESTEEPDKGFKECCYRNVVFASLDDNDDYVNDYNSWYFSRQLSSDNCDFVLINNITGDEYALNSSTYGEFKGFGSYPLQLNITTFRLDWKKVLQLLGEGSYSVRLDKIIAGINFPEISNSFKLESYSIERADNTIRIDSVMNGKLEHIDIDFNGVNFKNTLRTVGYFGNRAVKYIQDNIVRREKGYDEQISMIQENEYIMQTGLIPSCITNPIYDFILFSDEIFVSDYNLNNHSYKYKVHPVLLKNNKGSKYYTTIRDSRINLVFEDRYKNKRKINC